MKKETRIKAHSTGKSSGEMNLLKRCINSLVSAMKADYGHLFKSQFVSNEEIIMYQSRLYSKLEGAGYTKKDIVDGYEAFVDLGGKYPPTVPELLSSIKDKSRKVQFYVSIQKMARKKGADISCQSINDIEFNRRCVELGHPELCVAQTYSESELEEMKKAGKNFLKNLVLNT